MARHGNHACPVAEAVSAEGAESVTEVLDRSAVHNSLVSLVRPTLDACADISVPARLNSVFKDERSLVKEYNAVRTGKHAMDDENIRCMRGHCATTDQPLACTVCDQ